MFSQTSFQKQWSIPRLRLGLSPPNSGQLKIRNTVDQRAIQDIGPCQRAINLSPVS